MDTADPCQPRDAESELQPCERCNKTHFAAATLQVSGRTVTVVLNALQPKGSNSKQQQQ